MRRVAAKDTEREVRRTRRIAGGHARVRVLIELERSRPAGLNRIAKPVERTDAGVPAPGENERAGAPHPDHLVVDDVGRHADEGELASALPNQLVTRGVRNEMREAFERHDVAVMDELSHGFGERDALSHQKRSWAIRTGTDASRSAR